MMKVLDAAMRLIPGGTISYMKFTGNTINSMGIRVPSYDSRIAYGHIQPVPSKMYPRYGLVLGKEYKLLHVKADIVGTDQQTSGDLVKWNSKTYTVTNVSDWYGYDGWTRLVLTAQKEGEL